MEAQNEDIAEQRKRTKRMVEALGVGDANTTYH